MAKPPAVDTERQRRRQAGGRGAKRMSVGGTPGVEGEAAPSDSGADAPAPRKRTRSRTGTAAEQAEQAAELGAARAGSSDEEEAPARSTEVLLHAAAPVFAGGFVAAAPAYTSV